MQEDIRLCKDCKFMNKNYLHASECIREPVEIDPVDGTLFYLSCLQARRLQFGCGRLGKYFESKPDNFAVKFVKKIFKGSKE